MKTKFRKKLSQHEAEEVMETTRQSISVYNEHLWYVKTQRQNRVDTLINAMTGFKSREETIKEIEERLRYLWAKYEYCRQFSPDYKIKGSFGIF